MKTTKDFIKKYNYPLIAFSGGVDSTLLVAVCKEVFGDKTVDPFTGKAVGAKNGFEALKKVAQSVQQHTGQSCMDANGNVDLQKLQALLQLSGKNLGMISDDNITTLGDLGDAKSINVNNYSEQKQTGAVQHNQLGNYTDTAGKTQKVDDVWFQLAA